RERFLVHIAQHQYFLSSVVLYNCRHQSVRVFCKIGIHSLTFISFDFRYCFKSGIITSLLWKMPAANAASAFPSVNTSAKCAMLPAPPLAMTGTGRDAAMFLVISSANPDRVPSWSMEVSRI